MNDLAVYQPNSNTQQDSYVQKFYEKLQEIFTHWIPLEDVYYRTMEFGDLEFGKIPEISKWPDLGFFNVTMAKNGGPLAFMIQENVLFIGMKEIKSVIFVFSYYGKKINIINMAEKLNVSKDKLKWPCFQFTPDEDLCLISHDGILYLIDPLTGDFREKPLNLGIEFQQRGIVDAKLFDNTLIFRNTVNQFYYILNISNPVVQKFEYVPKLQDAQISDYIIIPKGTKGASALELLVPDPISGFHVISENKSTMYLQDLSKSGEDRSSMPFGKVSFLALNAKKDLLALYCEAETRGRIIVMKSNYTREFNRLDTMLFDAKALDWCGNDAPVLTYPDKVVLVGPNQYEMIDLRTKTAGIKCMNEIDGLRIVTSEKTYFLERVQKVLIETFRIASISPSAKLIVAQKSVDLNIPRADEIIRDLGSKDLIVGIEDLLEAASLEHHDISVMKHLLRTASFAKTFAEANEYDSNKYVNIVKHMIVLTKIRNSQSCGRAITYKQFEKFKAKNVLRLLLKFRDYRMALAMIDQLNLKQYVSQVYEEWCQTMIKYSTASDQELEFRLQEKFDQLKIKLAEDQGFNTSVLQFTQGGQQNQGPALSTGGRTNSYPVNNSNLIANQLPNNIKLNIDFTKLAKIADSKDRKRLAGFLISKEKSIVKKIPFLLEAQQYEEALSFAMEGGDPNIINKVFTEILKKYDDNYKQVIAKVSSIPDGLRQLRNFAKARKDTQLLVEIGQAIYVSSGGKVVDYQICSQQMKRAYESETHDGRMEQIRLSQMKLNDPFKDDFYAKLLEEQMDILTREKDIFKQTKDQRYVDASLSDLLANLLAVGQERDVRDIKQSLKLQEKYYFMMAIRGFAKANKWDEVQHFIQMKKTPVTYSFLAEICNEYGKLPLAVEAIKKISDYDEKIPMLIDISQWRDAIEESFNGKRLEYLDDIRQKGPAFVEDFIKEEQQKRNYKHISKIKKAGGAGVSMKGPPTGKKQINQRKIGEATAKRMQEKAMQKRGKNKALDEEIDSDIAAGDDVDMDEVQEPKNKGKALINDPFFQQEVADQNETIEEKRLKMTKQLLQELQQDGVNKADFFENLQTKHEAEVDLLQDSDDLLTKRLKYQILEKKGKLFYNIADDFTQGEHQRFFLKGHKKAITALEWSLDNQSVFTASKDCCIIKWDLESQKKLIFKGEKHNRAIEGHFDEPLCLATNGKYLVSGGKDRIVRVWDIHNQKQIQSFVGHRDSITSIKFDRENDQFYTVANDRSLKVWNIREMAYMDSHYGHQSDILGLDAFSTDRLLSCGIDRQVIFWKINEDSELLYKNEKHTADTINVINNMFFITGSIDNCIDLWIMNKKRPIYTLDNLHKNDSWILSTANVRNSDMFCSGSYDGQVLFYKLNKEKKNFSVVKAMDGLHGCLNTLKFSNVRGQNFNQLMLAVSHSKEERLGRWHVQPKVKDGLTIVVLLFSFYMGLFSKLEIKESVFPGGFYVYYDYQGHINSVALFHENLQKSLGIDTSQFTKLNINYDDPFNLKDPRSYRASLGFIFKTFDKQLIDKFKNLHYEWTSLPEAKCLYGEFPYRNTASWSFGSTRFLPACLTYILRNKKRLQYVMEKKAGTLEMIENNRTIKYYMVIEKQNEFYLSKHEQPPVKNEDKYTNLYYKKNK